MKKTIASFEYNPVLLDRVFMGETVQVRYLERTRVYTDGSKMKEKGLSLARRQPCYKAVAFAQADSKKRNTQHIAARGRNQVVDN